MNRVIELLDCSRPAVGKIVRVLEAAGIVRPLDERKKNRTVVPMTTSTSYKKVA